jgi:hypothetical protein
MKTIESDQMDLRFAHYNEVAPSLSVRRSLVFAAFQAYGASTCEEVAAKLCWEVTSVRPRCTELYQARKLVRTGERRNKQYVFRVEESV